MADLANLRTASLYINNQLLSRGLIRDGQTIDFADPAAAGDSTATMARIISVVNDLILRRDRDAQHRESLSATLRTVRAESLRQANDLQRAHERHAEAQRRADLGDAAEAALRAQLAAAEASVRRLRDDAARLRQLVAQTRAACAHEVRKRDRQIDGLKRAVTDAGRARGERRSPAVTTITISGSVGSDAGSASPGAATAPATDDPLRSETNAFLAALARSLSEDNEALLRLVRHTSRQLKTMSGFDEEEEREGGEDHDENDNDTNNDNDTPASADALARDMDAVLEHLRTILTNPSFVPIEEVMQRESEIGRLRDGWEKMEGRWKEAVHLLDGWRRRMAAGGGRPINVEEIKMGLRLSPVRVRSVAETAQGGLDLRLPRVEEADADDADAEATAAASAAAAASMELATVDDDEINQVDADNADNDDNIPSDSDSDASSVFDDDAPNVQIIEQSMVASTAPADTTASSWARSSPSPPPPAVPVPSRVTKEVLRPSGAAGNRGGAKATAAKAETTKQAAAPAAAPPRGRTRAPPAGARAAAEEVKADARPARVGPVARTAPAPTTTTTAPPTKSRGAARPDSAAAGARQRPAGAQTAATRTAATEREMPPPPAPSTTGPATATAAAASRARSRSPSKIATAVAPTSASSGSSASASSSSSNTTATTATTATGPSRLPLPTAAVPPASPALNMAAIAAKLAASEREADAARVRAKLKAARGARAGAGGEGLRAPARTVSATSQDADALDAVDAVEAVNTVDASDAGPGDPVKKRTAGRPDTAAPDDDAPPRKRRDQRRASKVASRRRSTLNPWELASLMGSSGSEGVGGA